ncbi:unnamed protein product [Trypanosoma congolense IL3000]|uniref:WGS project CAEQ00000000 data, annotated contig 2108 n=1 Tax=Trypanosoma congolense (strain IL3000) TaxID=1068625 RepID=F9WBH4_TRYCI|nr:unnamed protein product [Trypanosoma congolense IL3000]
MRARTSALLISALSSFSALFPHVPASFAKDASLLTGGLLQWVPHVACLVVPFLDLPHLTHPIPAAHTLQFPLEHGKPHVPATLSSPPLLSAAASSAASSAAMHGGSSGSVAPPCLPIRCRSLLAHALSSHLHTRQANSPLAFGPRPLEDRGCPSPPPPPQLTFLSALGVSLATAISTTGTPQME